MNLKEMFDEAGGLEPSSNYVDDLGFKRHKVGKKIKFMRGYTDDGELIFDPFDPKQRNESSEKTINYNKKFSKEMKQHHKLIRQQALYVEQLEKLFRATTGLGTSNPRQLTKTDVELASVLSQARGQLLQMINGVSSLKKTVADLQMKQWQKMAVAGGATESGVGTSDDLRGSAVLKQLLSSDLSNIQNTSIADLPDINEIDDDDSLVSVDVKNEGRNIQLAIIHDTETSSNIPVALNENGEIVDDYNIPSHMNDVDVFLTEGIAKTKFGETFPLIIR